MVEQVVQKPVHHLAGVEDQARVRPVRRIRGLGLQFGGPRQDGRKGRAKIVTDGRQEGGLAGGRLLQLGAALLADAAGVALGSGQGLGQVMGRQGEAGEEQDRQGERRQGLGIQPLLGRLEGNRGEIGHDGGERRHQHRPGPGRVHDGVGGRARQDDHAADSARQSIAPGHEGERAEDDVGGRHGGDHQRLAPEHGAFMGGRQEWFDGPGLNHLRGDEGGGPDDRGDAADEGLERQGAHQGDPAAEGEILATHGQAGQKGLVCPADRLAHHTPRTQRLCGAHSDEDDRAGLISR